MHSFFGYPVEKSPSILAPADSDRHLTSHPTLVTTRSTISQAISKSNVATLPKWSCMPPWIVLDHSIGFRMVASDAKTRFHAIKIVSGAFSVDFV